MTMTIGPACTIVFVGLSETNTIGWLLCVHVRQSQEQPVHLAPHERFCYS